MCSRYKIGILVILYLIDDVTLQVEECSARITVTEGPIVGRLFYTKSKIPFYGFLDIPYAKPPIGKLRFQEPRPIGKWKHTLNATENKKVCVQFTKNFSDPRETEDCLVLNVYVPGQTFCAGETANAPVIIWVHGGSFRSWFGTMDVFGPQYFMNNNIIMVSLNYRLGPLGFLSTGDAVIPGNLALKDQLLAIKWVSKNIKLFGGDPERVTLMGQSAGAMCVGYHMMNPKSRGLFSAAIMGSATPLGCCSLQRYPKEAAYLYGKSINKKIRKNLSSHELLKFLQMASLEELKNNSFIQLSNKNLNCQPGSSLIWTPSKEIPTSKNPIVTGRNYEKIKNGMVMKIPLLIGINSQESLYYGTDMLPLLAKVFDNYPSFMINGNVNIKNENNKIAAGLKIRSIYTNTTFVNNLTEILSYISDNFFGIPTAAFAYYHSKHSDVYFYRFAFKGILGNLNSSYPGVGHGEELNYLFEDKRNKHLQKFSKDEILTHERLVTLWSQFAKFRNPTKMTNSLIENISWPKVTQDKFLYINIDKTLQISENPTKLMQWLQIIEQFSYNLDTL